MLETPVLVSVLLTCSAGVRQDASWLRDVTVNMGFRFRKSFNLGGGFRINVSKSGIGYSWGAPGFRYTSTARHTSRHTYSIPGTGLSYVTEHGGKGRKRRTGRTARTQAHAGALMLATRPVSSKTAEASNAISTECIDISSYQPVEYAELLGHMKAGQRCRRIGGMLMFTIVLAMASPFFVASAIVGCALFVLSQTGMRVPIEYSFDSNATQAYGALLEAWTNLNKNGRFWQTIAASDVDERTNGGASRRVQRIPAKTTGTLPSFMKSNVHPLGLVLRDKLVYFMPDKVLVVSKNDVGAIGYSDLKIGFGKTRFVETGQVPQDAKIIDRTWAKVNKNGKPDRRFKSNRQLPVCEYGQIVVTSRKPDLDFHIELMCSNSDTIADMEHAASRFAKFIRQA